MANSERQMEKRRAWLKEQDATKRAAQRTERQQRQARYPHGSQQWAETRSDDLGLSED